MFYKDHAQCDLLFKSLCTNKHPKKIFQAKNCSYNNCINKLCDLLIIFLHPAVSHVFQGPGFSGFRIFRVQVFHGPDFSGSRFFMVQVFQGPGFSRSSFSGSRFFRFQAFLGPGFSGSGSRVQVQGPSPGFRSIHFLQHLCTYILFHLSDNKEASKFFSGLC